MTAYMLADIKVTDGAWVAAYAAEAHHLVHKHGGKYLARSGNVRTLEGKPPELPLDHPLIRLCVAETGQQAMTVPSIEQVYFEVDRRWKVEALTRLIDVHDLKLGIVFCNTKRMVDELVEHLNTQNALA